jgi:F0F1-type ATP synthase membrane subunit b/b'
MLSVDATFGIQLLFFLISYFVLSNFLFKPYLAALSERERLTAGSEKQAEEIMAEHKEMKYQYEQKAKQLSVHVKNNFR